MVGLVLVSHSKKLAMALRELVLQMAGPDLPIAIAAGVGEDFEELGTDAVHISEVLQPFLEGDGAVVLMDLGSAILSAETALELLDTSVVADPRTKLRLCPAPIVEAAISAAVQASAGASLDDVVREANAALVPKAAQLGASVESQSAAPVPVATPTGNENLVEFDAVIENPHGLHARPAATLVQLVNRFQSDVQLTNQTGHRGPSSGRSLTGVSLLQARKGDSVRFSICGADAEQAAEHLKQLAAMHFGEAAESEVPLPAAPAKSAAAQPLRQGALGGVGASEGIAIGRALALNAAIPLADEGEQGSPKEELEKLSNALAQVAKDLKSEAAPRGAAAEILAAQALILSDPVLLDAVRSKISVQKVSAARAWREESAKLASSYSEMEDEYMRARAADVRDISASVLRAIVGESQIAKIQPDPPAILVTTELLPSEAMACDPKCVLGVLASAGSATAHAAILMRTLGIPMVVGAGGVNSAQLGPETVVAIDGASGEVWIDPSESELKKVRERQEQLLSERAALESAKRDPAFTRDGQRIEILANVGNAADAVQARENGAEGVGLLRTEFVYLKSKQMPTEDEQTASLISVLAGMGPGPVVIRTPDVGADKPLSYLPVAEEHNPFLGVRGLRLSFRHPAFFLSNLKAILRSGSANSHDVWIMFPMVTSPEELQQARIFADDAHAALEREGKPHCWPVKLGMMVEVPAAALLAERFAQIADFFSIGTNDLTQYVMAAERGNADLAPLQDTTHPAVLRSIQLICKGADAVGCHVSVCGDAASDPVAAALMVGAGVRSLSVRPNQVAAIKAQVRRFSIGELQTLAADAMKMDNSANVRKLAGGFLQREH
ncbi:MAG: phosphoenolpyruvate--protein phosphotransferase [Acidobacteria bacterium]|nr:MAG: phosphoenolpyruvate--protein phosphotransferase [Acidobacteriota bacterium]